MGDVQLVLSSLIVPFGNEQLMKTCQKRQRITFSIIFRHFFQPSGLSFSAIGIVVQVV